jgi:hypothetical protein
LYCFRCKESIQINEQGIREKVKRILTVDFRKLFGIFSTRKKGYDEDFKDVYGQILEGN